MADKSISYYKLSNQLRAQGLTSCLRPDQKSDSFQVITQFDEEDKFIEPLFSLSYTTVGFEKSDVILVSAPGATGKTMLTNNISKSLNIPVLNLRLHEPVASYSLTGVLTKVLGPKGFAEFTTRLQNGTGAMLIDALDEGFVKTTDMGFFAFLEDLVQYANGAEGTPFVLLGRTNIMDLTTLYLEEKGLNVSQIIIEPFTESQAKDYIDRRVTSETKITNRQQYEAVRDYVIEALESFFKNQNEINHNLFRQFIGYAPVLNAIALLFNKHKNYHKLLESFRQGNSRNIDLLIEIVTKILDREKEEKISPNLLDEMLVSRDDVFKDEVMKKAYSVREQCCRLLAAELGESIIFQVSSDPNFNSEYNKNIQSFAKEHPFLSQDKIQNVVFLSFIIATLVNDPEYKNLVFRYLKSKYNCPYPLFDIYDKIAGKNRKVDLNFAPYLFLSLQALNTKKAYASMEIVGDYLEDNTSSNQLVGNVVFSRPGKEESIVYSFDICDTAKMSLCPVISNTRINLPISIDIPGNKIELTTPISIDCRQISCTPSEILISKGNDADEKIRLSCESILIDYSRNGTISLVNHDNMTKGEFEIISANQLAFPFVDFHTRYIKKDVSVDIEKRFHKLKNIIGWFRSHSKGDLARYKELIDNIVVGSNPTSRKIVNSLLKCGIFYVDESKYFINSNRMTEILGVSRDSLMNNEITDKAKDFLSKLD